MTLFPSITFSGQLRASQAEVVQLASRRLAQGQRRLHIVAPPGSGKTVLGLYLWAHLIKRPAIVLSPNSAIQAQWAARTDMFQSENSGGDLAEDWISTVPDRPGLLTSLTYQSLTLPDRKNEDWDQQACELWKEKLVDKGQAQDLLEAKVWLEDLQTQNPDYYEDRLTRYRKQVREGLAADGRNLELLHQSSRQALEAARRADVGLLILDECHHLVGHWGRVLHEVVHWLGDPLVIGLTATPPDVRNKSADDIENYRQLLGEIQYEVPVPAVVKDGFLAPYQDLVQFVRPSPAELDFISNVDRSFRELLDQVSTESGHEGDSAADSSGTPDLQQGVAATPSEEVAANAPRSLVPWVRWTLQHLQLPQGQQSDWRAFEKRDPTFAQLGRQLLLTLGQELPPGVPRLTLPPELLAVRQRIQGIIAAVDAQEINAPAFQNETQSRNRLQRTNQPLHDLPLSMLTPLLDRYIRHRLRRSSLSEDREKAESLIGRLRVLGIQITETGYQSCASPVSRVLAYSESKSQAMVEILKREEELLGEETRAVVVTDYERTSAVESELQDLMDEHAGGAVAAFRQILTDPTTNRLDPILLTGSTVLVDQDLGQRLMALADSWLQQRQLSVQLHSTRWDNYIHLEGRGSDWCPRVYVELLTEFFQQGVTRCLVGTRGLLGEGWDASRINVLVDLTTVTTSMSINQLRGRSIRLDRHWPEKTANNWDVVCVAPEFAKGFDDYERFRKKHVSLFGVTDDGQVEKGAGHVHPMFDEVQPRELEVLLEPLNQEMMKRAGQRNQTRAAWKIGQPYEGHVSHSVEVRNSMPGGQFPPAGWRTQQWNTKSLTETLGRVVLRSLSELGKVATGELQVNERENQSIRLFLRQAAAEDAERFAAAISELLGPLDEARYIIPRQVTTYQANWLSRWFPDYMARWLATRRTGIAMWHMVPRLLAGNRKEVAVFEHHWNAELGPGQAIYVHRGEGRKQWRKAVESELGPDWWISPTEIFQ